MGISGSMLFTTHQESSLLDVPENPETEVAF